jgi:hypothetical protein
MRRVLVSAAAVLALSACAKKEETAKPAEGSAATSSAAAPAVASARGRPMTPPDRRPGLWEQTMSTAGMKQVSKICFDEAVAKKMSLWGQQASETNCSQQSLTPTLGGWKFASSCKMGAGGTIVSSGEAKGDFNSHYTVAIHSTTTGASVAQMNGVHDMTLEATWKGPCPPGFKPGDIELPTGMKINMLAVDASAGAAGRPTAAQIAAMRAQMKKQMAADEAAKSN